MKLHGNAALSLNQRRRLVRRVVEEEWSLTKAAEAAEVSEPTARKWVRRYRAEGEAGLLDRPSVANQVHNRTCERRIQLICLLRHLRMTGASTLSSPRRPSRKSLRPPPEAITPVAGVPSRRLLPGPPTMVGVRPKHLFAAVASPPPHAASSA